MNIYFASFSININIQRKTFKHYSLLLAMRRKSTKLVRRQSVWAKISSYPFDLLLRLNEDFELIDWDSLAVQVGLPLGAVCSGLLMICRAYWSSKLSDDSDPFFKSPDADASDVFRTTAKRSLVAAGFSFLSLFLVSLVIINAIFCYTRKKQYTLLSRDRNSVPDTPSAHRHTYDAPDSPAVSPLRKLTKALFNSGSNEDPSSTTWVVDAWNPPMFSMHVACTFSPLHALLIWYSPFSFGKIAFLGALSCYLYYIMISFLTLMKDRSIIYSEVMGEYTQKVVAPVLAVSRRDVCVGTDDNEASFYSPSQNTKYVSRNVRPAQKPKLPHSLSAVNLSPWTPRQSFSPSSGKQNPVFVQTPSPSRKPRHSLATSVPTLSASPSMDSLRHRANLNNFYNSGSRGKSPLRDSQEHNTSF